MVCEHLRAVEEAMVAAGAKETFRGQAWSSNCREWVYYDRPLDTSSLKLRLNLQPCVVAHEHLGTHDGQEAGLICQRCKDGIMGPHPAHTGNSVVK